MGTLAGFFAEARRRRVFRTAGLYIVGAWVLLQVADLALESLDMPSGLLRYFWLAAFVVFPFALVFGWYYDVTAEGIQRTPPASATDGVELALKVPDYVIIVALAVVVGIVGAGLLERIRTSDIGFDGIAVLPLENLSGDEDQDYFSAGMQDALITNLSKIRSLRVVSRTSTMRLDRTLSIPQIGDLLGVKHIVEGSVTREGNKVRIIVQLIDAAKDAHVWAENFEREFTGVLSLQNEMARAIADAVDVQLSDSEQTALSRQPDIDADAYDTYLRGMHLINNSSNRVRRRGIKILEQLVADDSTSALVYSGLAYGYAQLGHSPYPEGMYPAAKRAAEQALALDSSLAEAHLAVGMLKLYYEWDFPAAEAALLHAIELNPSLVGAHFHLAWLYELMLDSGRALPPGEETVRLDPLSPMVRVNLGDQYRKAGMYEQALQMGEETLELDPSNTWARRLLALTYLEMGAHDLALQQSEQLQGNPMWGFVHGIILAETGRVDEAREILAGIERSPRNVVPLLRLHATLGDKDEVLRWIEVAREVRLPWYPWFLTWFPQADQYKDNQRFRELAEEIGLTQAMEKI